MKCIVCNKKSVGRITVDLDVGGWSYCKKHREDVKAAFLWMILGVHELADSVLKEAAQKDTIKTTKGILKKKKSKRKSNK